MRVHETCAKLPKLLLRVAARRRLHILFACSVCFAPTLAAAYDSLFARVKADASLAQIFPDGTARADLQDGMLIGSGSEQIKHMPDGRLTLTRKRHYTSVRRLDTKQVAQLPQPWEANSNIVLEPSLRLVQADTRFVFNQEAGDAIFPGYKLSEEQKWLFEADHSVLKAVDKGQKLQMQLFRSGKLVKQKTIDYPPDSAPIDTIGLYLSVAVARGVDNFDFQLLVPGDGSHGIRAQIHRTRDVTRFAEGYGVPKARLHTLEPVAMLDMRLASPIKYLFYPHHFFMAYSVAHPEQLMMMWGGDAGSSLQAFRRE
jgi:hypothetical protein